MNMCIQRKQVTVLKSPAGYYIGTYDSAGPYCRLSEQYFKTEDQAKHALKNRLFTEREGIELIGCNGTSRNCLMGV